MSVFSSSVRRIDPTKEPADAIFLAVELNTENPAREFMWGAPGTMLAALFMYEFTQELRWKELYARSAARILSDMVKVAGPTATPGRRTYTARPVFTSAPCTVSRPTFSRSSKVVSCSIQRRSRW